MILSLEGGSFAIPITKLLEITVPRNLQKDPNLTAVFEGKVEFRGKWAPVLNLKKLFQIPGGPGTVLLAMKGAKGVLCLLVDAVTEIIESSQKPAALPQGVVNPTMQYYRGVIRHKGELVLLLNEDGLLQ